VDLLVEEGGKQHAYEIKAGATCSPDYFKGLSFWSRLSGADAGQCNVIYAGEQTLKGSRGQAIAWERFTGRA
jgi:hypothetical protein